MHTCAQLTQQHQENLFIDLIMPDIIAGSFLAARFSY